MLNMPPGGPAPMPGMGGMPPMSPSMGAMPPAGIGDPSFDPAHQGSPVVPTLPMEETFYLNEENMRKYAGTDQSVWSRRNTRMYRHRKLYELVKPPKNKLKPGQVATVTTDAKAIVHKLAGMFANHPPAISCVSEDPQQAKAAERCADFLRTFRRKETKRYGRGPHGPRAYDEALYISRDGMIADITALNPADTAFPYTSQLLDPMTVFPTYDGEDMSRCTIKYRTTLAEAKKLCLQYGRQDLVPDAFAPGGSMRQDSLPVDVVKVFCNEGGDWELGLMVRNEVVTIQKLGYCPVTIVYANARIYQSTVSGEMSNIDRYENVGVGVYDVIEEALKNKNEDYSIMREMMQRDANPPRVIFTDDEGKLDDLRFNPGENVHLWADDKFQLVQLTPDFRKIESLLQLDQQGIDRGTIPAQLYGEGNSNSSAQDFMMLGNARDQLFVFQAALERFYEEKYAKVLALYRDYASKINLGMPGQIQATFTTQDPASGIKLGGQPFSPDDVQALGPEPDVVVEFSDVTPQNEVARTQMASNLANAKIIDLRTAREFLPAPFNQTPELIGQRVLQDISLMHPAMTQIMAMTAALYSPDPVQRAIAGMMLPNLIGQAQQQAAMPPGAPGPNGGANPTPGQNGVPANHTQMPPSANPPETGVRNGMPEGHPTPQAQPSQPGVPS